MADRCICQRHTMYVPYTRCYISIVSKMYLKCSLGVQTVPSCLDCRQICSHISVVGLVLELCAEFWNESELMAWQ